MTSSGTTTQPADGDDVDRSYGVSLPERRSEQLTTAARAARQQELGRSAELAAEAAAAGLHSDALLGPLRCGPSRFFARFPRDVPAARAGPSPVPTGA